MRTYEQECQVFRQSARIDEQEYRKQLDAMQPPWEPWEMWFRNEAARHRVLSIESVAGWRQQARARMEASRKEIADRPEAVRIQIEREGERREAVYRHKRSLLSVLSLVLGAVMIWFGLSHSLGWGLGYVGNGEVGTVPIGSWFITTGVLFVVGSLVRLFRD